MLQLAGCVKEMGRRTVSDAAGVGLEAAGWTAIARFWFAVVLVAAGVARSTCNVVLVSAPVRFCLHGDVCHRSTRLTSFATHLLTGH